MRKIKLTPSLLRCERTSIMSLARIVYFPLRTFLEGIEVDICRTKVTRPD